MRFAYLRVSSEHQFAENQRSDVESICSGDVEWVVEHGSAWKQDGLKYRPEFRRIYDLVKQGTVSHLYVWDLDRIWRKRKQQVGFLKLCKARGCLVLSYRQKFLKEIENAPEPWNEIIYDLIIQIFAHLAEEESQKKSDRIRIAYEKNSEGWGRPRAKFNEHRAYYLLFEESRSLREVGEELGVSHVTLGRYKKVWQKNPPSFIKEEFGKKTDDYETEESL